MSVNLTGILGDLSSALPSTQDVLQNVLVGAGAIGAALLTGWIIL